MQILDTLEGTDDYEMTVAVIDVDPREEKILNVQINNESSMGNWDIDALGALNLQDGIGFDEMGFIEGDVELMFGGDERFTELFQSEEAQGEKDKLADIKKDRKEVAEKLAQEQSADFYFVVVCKDQKDKEALMQSIGYPAYEEFVYSDALRRLGTTAE